MQKKRAQTQANRNTASDSMTTKIAVLRMVQESKTGKVKRETMSQVIITQVSQEFASVTLATLAS